MILHIVFVPCISIIESTNEIQTTGGNDIMNLQESKRNALEAYKIAKRAYLENRTNENWKAFCDAKIVCMKLGVRI